MAQQESDLLFPKYTRIGYIEQDRVCDKLVKVFMHIIPGQNRLPPRWKYFSLEYFNTTYGHLGTILWAASYNSQLLLINGNKIIRIWTDTKNWCWVEGLSHVLDSFETVEIPKGNIRKSKPFTHRVKISSIEDMEKLANKIKQIYGV